MIALILSLSALAGVCEVDTRGGVVHTEPTVAGPLDDAGRACLHEVGASLAARAGLRTVTVVVSAADSARVDGSGQALADAWVQALVEGGVPASRVSGVVKAGDALQAVVSFSERHVATEVGVVESVGGHAFQGTSPAELSPVDAGARLQVGTWVVTGSDSYAALALSDGSKVRLRPDTSLQVGQLHLDADLKRVVDLEVARGGVDLSVAHEPGRFDVRTPQGTAGVRGTVFRLSVEEGGATRLETVEGLVALSNDEGEVEVGKAQGGRVYPGKAPLPPVDLPAAPEVRAPLEGALPKRGLRWRGRADGWVVEVAEDAEFTLGVHQAEVHGHSWRPQLSSGTWYWRVMAVDAQGFVGLPSKVYAFEVE